MTKSKRKIQSELRRAATAEFLPIPNISRFSSLDDEADSEIDKLQSQLNEQQAANVELQTQLSIMNTSMQQMQKMMEMVLLRDSTKSLPPIPSTPIFGSPGFVEINDLLSQNAKVIQDSTQVEKTAPYLDGCESSS